MKAIILYKTDSHHFNKEVMGIFSNKKDLKKSS